MPSQINLSRNTRVFFTTNINPSTGVLTDAATGTSAWTAANTVELNVLDGYSFSQGTQQQTITLSEAGNTPTRGQRSFNTQLDAVEWSLSTYIRPSVLGTTINAQERVLWNALLGAGTLDTTGVAITTLTRASTTGASASIATLTPAAMITATVNGVTAALAVGDVINVNGVTSHPSWNAPVMITAVNGSTSYTVQYFAAPSVAATATATGTAMKAYTGQWGDSAALGATRYSYVSTEASNRNQLQRFALIFSVDNVLYAIDNCALDQVSVDFGLDAIATAAWSGKGTALKQLTTLTLANITGSAATLASVFTSSNTQYITNKLSTLTLESNIGGLANTTGSSNFSYAVPITGGNLTIANNITYLVPANIGVVNNPINYFTGQRSITGNVTAYLKTGTSATNNGAVQGDSANLLSTLLAAASSTSEPKYRIQLEMGGKTTLNRVEFEMPGVVLQIPSVNIADVVACTINFTAQGFNPDTVANGPGTFDVSQTNELIARYFAA